ncbi:cell division protein FtsZ [Helicobacter jaachi]|uniref:Cell division protein FtsZ n=1 Tax=Helicobacter jaachi TaxID=1677920 RepID=A0A4V6I2N9_9HELI|nr:cell division protein FtsZ [Helicobacter jaachi]TLD96842.1 cell division protein FtsZ [Helicobacter jaachi]
MENINLNIQEIRPEGAVITAIGVGGGGTNMISHLAKTNPHKAIKLIAANTDVQHLEGANANVKMKLGEKLTKGLGAGMHPDVGEKAALETYEELKQTLSGSDIVFISAGLGGGTGTGAAPVVAKAAKEVGALTVSIVTKPFKWEGGKRTRLAEEGLRNLKAESDCIIVIPNERLLSIIPKNCGFQESFKIVNDVLARAVNGISGVILSSGANDINVDFADVRTVMSHKGLALMGTGEANGDSAACDAMRMALESPLLDNISIKDAKGVLVNFEIHRDYPLAEIAEAMNIVDAIAADSEADIVFGTCTLKGDAQQDFVRITVVATGFEKEVVGDTPSVQTPADKDLEHSRKSLQLRRASGESYHASDDYSLFNNDSIDVPTYLRNQKD